MATMSFQSSPSSSGVSPARYYARAFALATIAVLGYLLYIVLSVFSGPIMWAGLLAFMLHPLQRRLLNRWKRPMLVAGAVTALTFVVVAGPVALFGFAFVQQASTLLARFQNEAKDRNLPALELVLELRPVQLALEKTRDITSLSKEEILLQASEAAQAALQELASTGGRVVLGAFSTVSRFLFMLFLLFFFLRDGREMLQRGIRLIPMTATRKADLAAHLGAVTRGVVMGTLATALVQGSLLGVGFAIAGIPSPLVFAGVGAMASLVPIVGTALLWVPAAVTLVALGQAGWAIFLTLWCAILVAGSDNVVKPLIISGSANVSALLVFTGLLGGVSAFGVVGIFVGPLLLSLVSALLRYADELAPNAPHHPIPAPVSASGAPPPPPAERKSGPL
jgi:predicted PurR-regulated permease PerM